jgi:hypothetical protein
MLFLSGAKSSVMCAKLVYIEAILSPFLTPLFS